MAAPAINFTDRQEELLQAAARKRGYEKPEAYVMELVMENIINIDDIHDSHDQILESGVAIKQMMDALDSDFVGLDHLGSLLKTLLETQKQLLIFTHTFQELAQIQGRQFIPNELMQTLKTSQAAFRQSLLVAETGFNLFNSPRFWERLAESQVPTRDELLAMPAEERDEWMKWGAFLAKSAYDNDPELTATTDAVDLYEYSDADTR